jgi:hypothetical protein
MTRSVHCAKEGSSDVELDALITSMSTVIVDASGPAGIICDLTSQLAQTSLDPTLINHRVAYYYTLHVGEMPSYFRTISIAELADSRVRSVLMQYRHWFDAKDTELLFEDVPEDAWVLDVISRVMVGVIASRAEARDARMPACSPQDHPCSPFWSRSNIE